MRIFPFSIVLLIVLVPGCDPVLPDAACDAMLDCVAEADPLGVGQATAWFGPEGGCWADAVTAQRCAAACEEARADLAARDPEAIACHPDPLASLDSRVGDAEWDWTLRSETSCEGADALRGAYNGRVESTPDVIRVSVDALGGVTWECSVVDASFACGPANAATGATLTLEGSFHPSYVELEGSVSQGPCVWALRGWRRVPSTPWR